MTEISTDAQARIEAYRDASGRFGVQPATEADPAQVLPPVTTDQDTPTHQVDVSELHDGMKVERDGDGNFHEIISVDNDHKSTSVEFADGGFESYRNDEQVTVGGYADPSDHMDEDTLYERFVPQQGPGDYLTAAQVADVPTTRVWSVTHSDEDDSLYVDAGRREGAAGYITTTEPWVRGNESGVLYTNESDVWMTDEEYAELHEASTTSDDPVAARQVGLEAMSRWNPDISGDRGQTSMRGLASMMEQGLTSEDERTQRDGYLMAAAARREGVGFTGDEASTVMRGIAPHLTDVEVASSAERLDESLTREAQLLSGDRAGSHPDDEKTLVGYRARHGAQAVPAGDAHEAASAYHDQAVRETERAVACSRERSNPRVSITAAPVPTDPDHQEYKAGRSDPGVKARSVERREITALADSALWEGRPLDTSAEAIDPATVTPKSMAGTEAAKNITSVLIQRGRHPEEARDYAARITHAHTMATYFREGDPGTVMDAADKASTRSGHTIVGVSQRDVTDWVDVPTDEDPADADYWAEANQEYWAQEAHETTREALRHPYHYAPRL